MIYPSRAFYKPGEIVAIEIPGTFLATIWHLGDKVAVLEGHDRLEWTPPPYSKRGYLVQVAVNSDMFWTAFDVLDHWTDAPHYGFLFDFRPQRTDIDLSFLLARHINGIQFYDWMYRHDTLLPPSETFDDPLGRTLSLNTIEKLINEAHRLGMAAMPYTAIYGASPEFATQHHEWCLYDENGTLYDFADGFLKIMNPASDWRTHFASECQSALSMLPFDGIHVDQYGEPQTGWDVDGQVVDLPLAFAHTLRVVHNTIPVDKALVFNLVHNWPLETIADSPVDFLYCELWPPMTTLHDIAKTIRRNWHAARGKTPVVAVYINPEFEQTVKLLECVILASGGYHIVHGESGLYLSDPYFPKSGKPSESLAQYLLQLAHFGVAYEELLSFAAPCHVEVKSSENLWVIPRKNNHLLTLSLLNASSEQRWDRELANHTEIQGVVLEIRTTEPVEQIWCVTPDESSPPCQIDYMTAGEWTRFMIPKIDIWSLVCIQLGG